MQLVAPNSNCCDANESKYKPTDTCVLIFPSYTVRIKLLAMIVLLSLYCFSAFSQSAVIENTNDLISKDGITIASAMQNCENVKNGISKEYVLLSISNQNNYPVHVSFKKNLWFDGKCKSCSSTSDEHIVSLTIEANKQAEGSCDENNGLRLFSRMLNLDKVRKLTNYELIDITVNEIK